MKRAPFGHVLLTHDEAEAAWNAVSVMVDVVLANPEGTVEEDEQKEFEALMNSFAAILKEA